MNNKLTRFGVAMPEQLLAQFDKISGSHGLPNRSVALRHLVRQYIASSSWQEGAGEVAGSITMLYNHHSNDVINELTAIQHDYGEIILCTTHVHITHETCLECLVVKGAAFKIKALENALNALKGMHSVTAAITGFISD